MKLVGFAIKSKENSKMYNNDDFTLLEFEITGEDDFVDIDSL